MESALYANELEVVELMKIRQVEKLITEYIASFDCEKIRIAFSFMGQLAVMLTDIEVISCHKPVHRAIDLKKLRIQLRSCEQASKLQVYWCLSNILADPTHGKPLCTSMLDSYEFTRDLVSSAMQEYGSYFFGSHDLLAGLLHHASKQQLLELLERYNLLEVPFAAIQRDQDQRSVLSGLQLLEDVISACNKVFPVKKLEDNPSVKIVIHNDRFCNLLDGLMHSKLKAVFEAAESILSEYFPTISS